MADAAEVVADADSDTGNAEADGAADTDGAADADGAADDGADAGAAEVVNGVAEACGADIGL